MIEEVTYYKYIIAIKTIQRITKNNKIKYIAFKIKSIIQQQKIYNK